MESGAMDNNNTSTSPSSIEEIKQKMHFTGTVVKLTLAGAIVDIGLDTPGVIHISQLQKEPVKRVEDVLQVGQSVDVWVRRVFTKKGRIDLTMIKPLNLEWNEIKKDMVVSGKVTRLERFGVFVDIGAERPGLVHISELTHDFIRTPDEVVKEGEEVEVQVLDVNRQKKQIRLSMKSLEVRPETVMKSSQPKVEKKSKKAKDSEPETDIPVPTAMEVALREAMDRVKPDENEEELSVNKPKPEQTNEELENILSRTLKNRVPTKQ
jgi:ribosomal protein S1